jgi:hypothetical protein
VKEKLTGVVESDGPLGVDEPDWLRVALFWITCASCGVDRLESCR